MELKEKSSSKMRIELNLILKLIADDLLQHIDLGFNKTTKVLTVLRDDYKKKGGKDTDTYKILHQTLLLLIDYKCSRTIHDPFADAQPGCCTLI
jgi:hypothetical protein